MKKETSASLTKKREIGIRNLQNNWDIIKNFNDHDTRQPEEFDIPKVYEDIMRIEREVVDAKIHALYLNLGFSNVAQIPTNSIQETIFWRSQLKDRINQLTSILKRKRKTGKFIKVFLSDEFFQEKLAETEKRLTIVNAKMDSYNAEKTFMVNEKG